MASALNRTTDATVEPVLLTELKELMRVRHTDEDAAITFQAKTARKYIEDVASRQLVNATWKYEIDNFPDRIIVPRPPLSSVATLKYVNGSGTQTTLVENTDYEVFTTPDPGFVQPVFDGTWPTVQGGSLDVELIYVAGYGASGTSVPENYRLAIIAMVTYWWEYREPIVVGQPVSKPLQDHLASLMGMDANWVFS